MPNRCPQELLPVRLPGCQVPALADALENLGATRVHGAIPHPVDPAGIAPEVAANSLHGLNLRLRPPFECRQRAAGLAVVHVNVVVMVCVVEVGEDAAEM